MGVVKRGSEWYIEPVGRVLLFASASAPAALRLAALESELSAPLSLVEMSQSQLDAIDGEAVIADHVLPAQADEAKQILLESNSFRSLSEEEQHAAIDASLAEVDAAEREGRPVDGSVSSLLQTSKGKVTAADYWSNASNRRQWCNAVRHGYWSIEKHPHWQSVCSGIEKFRPWGWWSHFCHNIHNGEWGKWYRKNAWWKQHCNSIRNPHYKGSKRAWVWHPQHKRHQHSKWCEKNGHLYRDLNNAHYNHWCYGREAPRGFRRGYWDVDPQASKLEQANFWFCKAYRGYERSWKLNGKFPAYRAKCLKGEGARGAKHPGFNPKMTPAQLKKVKAAAKKAGAKAKAAAAAPQWKWSAKVARTQDSDWCEKNGLTQSSSQRFQKSCEGNRETAKERLRRIKRAVRRARRAVLRRIPHKHHRKTRGTKQQRAARRAIKKAKKKAKRAKKSAARRAKRSKKRANRRARRAARLAQLKAKWAAMSPEAAAKAKAEYQADQAKKKAARRVNREKKRSKRKRAAKKKKAARKAKKAKKGKKGAKRRSRAERRADRKYRRFILKFGKTYADQWKAARAARIARRKARRGTRGRKGHKKVKQIPVANFDKSPLVAKAKQDAKIKAIKAKMSPKRRALIKAKLAKLTAEVKKGLPKGVKPEDLSAMLDALKVAVTIPVKGRKGKGDKGVMPPAPKMPAQPKTAPKLSELKRVAAKQLEANVLDTDLTVDEDEKPTKRVRKGKNSRRRRRRNGKKGNKSRRGRKSRRVARKSNKSRRSNKKSLFSKKRSAKNHKRGGKKSSKTRAAEKAARKAVRSAAREAAREAAKAKSASAAPKSPSQPQVPTSTRDTWQRETKGFQGHTIDLTGMDSAAAPRVPAGMPPPQQQLQHAKKKLTIEEIWAKEDAARRLARQKRIEKEDAEDKAEESRIRKEKRLNQLRAAKKAEAAKKPASRRATPGETIDWNAKFPSSLPHEPKPEKPSIPYAPAPVAGASGGCPGCKNRGLRKKWKIVLDPTSVAEIDRPLIEELHRRVDYLIEPVEKTLNTQEQLLRDARKQVIDAEEHHIRVYDFGEKHANQLLIPQYIQDEQKIVQLE